MEGWVRLINLFTLCWSSVSIDKHLIIHVQHTVNLFQDSKMHVRVEGYETCFEKLFFRPTELKHLAFYYSEVQILANLCSSQ